MIRATLDAMIRAFDVAYRHDRYHGLKVNLEDIRPEEWLAEPVKAGVVAFGTGTALSIAQVTAHAGAIKRMYLNHPFGDRTLAWEMAVPPSMEQAAVLEWLEEGHLALLATLEELSGDADLLVERHMPRGRLVPTHEIITLVTNHDLYHSGEINRQRSLLRGAESGPAV
jgi:uncharacterized damage-inducible protein DinB